MRMSARKLLALIATLVVGTLLSFGSAQYDTSQEANFTIAFGPGGGNDIMSRTIVEILEKYDLYPGDIVATNRAGGSGAVGWGYLFNQEGSDHDLSTTSGSFITTPLQADTPWNAEDFVPIALLATDDLVLLVNGDSEYDTFEEWLDAARENTFAIGGIGAVNVDFIVPQVLSSRAGFEFDYVSFNEAGNLNTALLSGALDAIVSNPGEVMGLMESGDMKGLAYSGASTPAALGDMPTFGDAGYDLGISMPRGLIMAPGASEEAQQWWIETMQEVVETPEWAAYIDNNLLTEDVRYGDDFFNFLLNVRDTFEDILREEGAID